MKIKDVYFVRNDRLFCTRIVGSVSVDVEIFIEAGGLTPNSFLHGMVGAESNLNRPGTWYKMDNGAVVHSDQCFDTREEAVEAFSKKLLGH